jgi:hypothetical protein
MSSFSMILPEDFSSFEWEVSSKGFFELRVEFCGRWYDINFYDRERFNQEVNDALDAEGIFFDPNVVIVEKVSESSMFDAVSSLIKTNRFGMLVPNEG